MGIVVFLLFFKAFLYSDGVWLVIALKVRLNEEILENPDCLAMTLRGWLYSSKSQMARCTFCSLIKVESGILVVSLKRRERWEGLTKNLFASVLRERSSSKCEEIYNDTSSIKFFEFSDFLGVIGAAKFSFAKIIKICKKEE